MNRHEELRDRLQKLDTGKAMKGFGIMAVGIAVLNLALGLGFIGGVCWIVKHFFFN